MSIFNRQQIARLRSLPPKRLRHMKRVLERHQATEIDLADSKQKKAMIVRKYEVAQRHIESALSRLKKGGD